MRTKLNEAITDAIFMFKNIKEARTLPPYANVQAQYVAMGERLREAFYAELDEVQRLRAVLEEVLDECKDEYDVDPDPTGGHHDVPNRWMRIGTMIEEALRGKA